MFCSECGKEIRDGLKFCTHCGAAVGGGQAKNPDKSVKSAGGVSKRAGMIAVIIILVILILGAVAAVFWLFSSLNTDGASGGETPPAVSSPASGAASSAEYAAEPTATAQPTAEPTVAAQPTTQPTATAQPTATPVPAEQEDTADMALDRASTPVDALQHYVEFFVNAVNSGDYSGAEKIMSQGSAIYNMQKKVVKRLHQRGIREEVQTCWATETRWIDERTAEVTSEEAIKVYYSDGTQKVVEQSYIYTCTTDSDGYYLLTDMREKK